MRQSQKRSFEDLTIEGEPAISAKAKMSLAILNNEMAEADYKIQYILTIFLEDDAKLDHDNEWWTYHERNS